MAARNCRQVSPLSELYTFLCPILQLGDVCRGPWRGPFFFTFVRLIPLVFSGSESILFQQVATFFRRPSCQNDINSPEHFALDRKKEEGTSPGVTAKITENAQKGLDYFFSLGIALLTHRRNTLGWVIIYCLHDIREKYLKLSRKWLSNGQNRPQFGPIFTANRLEKCASPFPFSCRH